MYQEQTKMLVQVAKITVSIILRETHNNPLTTINTKKLTMMRMLP